MLTDPPGRITYPSQTPTNAPWSNIPPTPTQADSSTILIMEDVAVVEKPSQAQPKKLKPARKQVKPGQIEKKETPQTGKEYSR